MAHKNPNWRSKLDKKRKARFAKPFTLHEVPEEEIRRSERVNRMHKLSSKPVDYTGTPLY